jgi:hypothetical protein
MDDDGIAEVTATLRFDRAILLFWYFIDNILIIKKKHKTLSKDRVFLFLYDIYI